MELESLEQQIQAMEEENQGEEDMYAEARGKSGKITKQIDKRIKIIKNDLEYTDELKILLSYKELFDKKNKFADQIKKIKKELDKNLFKKYNDLSEPKIKEVVIHGKWLTTIHRLIDEEMEQISHKLARRISELAERYETPLPILAKEIQIHTKKVNDHLEQMGFK